jgi:hypothetical protein
MKNRRIRTTAARLLSLAITAIVAFGQTAGRKSPPAAELVERFENTRVFW